MNTETIWKIEDGVKVARLAESVAIGCDFHVAMGGSVLIQGESGKDLDLMFYPHKTGIPADEKKLFEALKSVGFDGFEQRNHEAYGDNKVVYKSEFFGKRVDCFLLNCTDEIAATAVQPIPHGIGPDIVDLVKADLDARREIGRKTYGQALKANNGRDALVDAYQETLDLCQYLRQVIEERK